MRLITKFLVLAIAFVGLAAGAFAQETQTRVVDEVVAQINEDVITLSRVKREMKEAVDSLVEQGKTREDAQKLVDEKQGELIASLINEELLVQKSKEIGLDSEIEASLNQRVADLMKQYGFKTVEALYAEMEKQGANPQELRENWRKAAVRERVVQREVQSKIYWGLNGKDLKDYYEKNKAKFTKPETVSFSELFLGFAGRDIPAVREKARSLHTALKAGADFAKVAKENSDPGLITQGTGKAEDLNVADLNAKIGEPLKGVKAGDVTAPFELDQMGMVILHVDDRKAASSESVFDESAVRLAITQERAPLEQKKFMSKLREDAVIRISDSYRPVVSPILFAEERKDKTAN